MTTMMSKAITLATIATAAATSLPIPPHFGLQGPPFGWQLPPHPLIPRFSRPRYLLVEIEDGGREGKALADPAPSARATDEEDNENNEEARPAGRVGGDGTAEVDVDEAVEDPLLAGLLDASVREAVENRWGKKSAQGLGYDEWRPKWDPLTGTDAGRRHQPADKSSAWRLVNGLLVNNINTT
jgi:hypothetical protein